MMTHYETQSAQARETAPSGFGQTGAVAMHDTPAWHQLSRGMPIQFRDHTVGTIEHIWVDTGHGGVGQIVVRLAAPPHGEITVPLDRLIVGEDQGVLADVDAAQVELLPAAGQ